MAEGGAAIVEIALAAGAALATLMAAAWLVQRLTGESGWIDAIWSFSVGAVGASAALAPISGQAWPGFRQLLVAGLALAWSLRLGAHIARRTLRGGDDPRYRALREEWGVDFAVRLFRFLQVQAAAALVLAVAIVVAARNVAPPGWGDAAGVAILGIALAGEALADAQLERFRASPGAKGKICEIGLWRFSRHPNYFFEWMAWLAYPVVAVGIPLQNVRGLIAFAAPALMYWLLAHASGIPPLEAHMARSRGAAFAAYQRRVNAFFPGPRHE